MRWGGNYYSSDVDLSKQTSKRCLITITSKVGNMNRGVNNLYELDKKDLGITRKNNSKIGTNAIMSSKCEHTTNDR